MGNTAHPIIDTWAPYYIARVKAPPGADANDYSLQIKNELWFDAVQSLADQLAAPETAKKPAPREQFSQAARTGTLTHDARVTLIRRYLYFRFRWSLSFDQVRAMEAARIAADPAFGGPRPDWVV